MTPIEIIVTQTLIEKPIRSNPILIAQAIQNSDRFCKMCPIVHPTLSQAEHRLGVPFALDCGDDNVCTSDLKVSGSFVGLGWVINNKLTEFIYLYFNSFVRRAENKFVIGSKYSLPLEISVLNSGESAYLTEIEVTLPENVDLKDIPSSCSENKENNTLIVLCEMDNPLRMNHQVI